MGGGGTERGFDGWEDSARPARRRGRTNGRDDRERRDPELPRPPRDLVQVRERRLTTKPLEYLPPAGLELHAIAARLPAPLHADGEEEASGVRAFYDTFDGRLRRKGFRLVHEDHFLSLLGPDGRELSAAPWPDAPETVKPGDLADGALREQVAPVCGIRVLIRSAEVQSSRRLL